MTSVLSRFDLCSRFSLDERRQTLTRKNLEHSSALALEITCLALKGATYVFPICTVFGRLYLLAKNAFARRND